MREPRKVAEWTVADDEYTDEPACWFWGDWCITRAGQKYWLIVSSGMEYGPFASWEAITKHAEDVRGD